MRQRKASFCIGVLLIISLGALEGHAQSAALKGNWIFTVNVPGLGTFPLAATFKPNGRGSMDFGAESLPTAYREDGARFSVAVEVPKEFSPTGAALTIILRGTKSSDNDATGAALFITETADPSSTLGLAVARGSFTGQRQ